MLSRWEHSETEGKAYYKGWFTTARYLLWQNFFSCCWWLWLSNCENLFIIGCSIILACVPIWCETCIFEWWLEEEVYAL